MNKKLISHTAVIITILAIILSIPVFAQEGEGESALSYLYIDGVTVELPETGQTLYENSSENDSTWWLTNSDGVFTLVLENANITRSGVHAKGDLSIIANGNNTISGSVQAPFFSCAIYIEGVLNFSGTGTLSAKVSNNDDGADKNIHFGIASYGISVSSGTLIGIGMDVNSKDSHSTGIIAISHNNDYSFINVTGTGTLDGYGGNVTITEGSSENGNSTGKSRGISAHDIYVSENGKLVGIAGSVHDEYTERDDNMSIICSGGISATNLYISDDADVSGIGGDVFGKSLSCFGISVISECNVNGGKISAIGGNATGEHSSSRGIDVTNKWTINSGNINTIGGNVAGINSRSYGAYIAGDFITDNCRFTATGGNISCYNSYSYGIVFTPNYNSRKQLITNSYFIANGGDTESDNSYSYGISCRWLNFDNSVVNGYGGKTTGKTSCSIGFYSNGDYLTLDSKSVINGYGGNTSGEKAHSYGVKISSPYLNINGLGKINGTSGNTEGNKADSIGIRIEGNQIQITDASLNAIGNDATGDSIGLSYRNDLILNQCSINATGKNYGVRSYDIFEHKYEELDFVWYTVFGGKLAIDNSTVVAEALDSDGIAVQIYNVISIENGASIVLPEKGCVQYNEPDKYYTIADLSDTYARKVLINAEKGIQEENSTNYLLAILLMSAYTDVEVNEGGNVTWEGRRVGWLGSDRTYVITPDDGYRIVDVIFNGESYGPVETLTVTMKKSRNTIQAIFEKCTESE